MKKTKQCSSPATNKTTLKQKEQQMKHNGPSSFQDDQLSFTLAFFASPKYQNFFIHTFTWALFTPKKN
jgi:hypothetical protein